MTKRLKILIHTFLQSLGYRFVRTSEIRQDFVIEQDTTFMHIYGSCKPYTMTSIFRCYALYQAVRYIVENDVEGDFVECGVWRGGSAMLIALTLGQLGARNRNIYLYDTFEGMTEPMDIDHAPGETIAASKKWEAQQRDQYNAWCYAGLEEVKMNMSKTGYPSEYIHYIQGDVAETIPNGSHEQISLLRLDTDWYASTKHELHCLYPLLVAGGVLIIDDYGAWEGARKAVDEYFSDRPILLNRVDSTGRVAIKI